MAVSKSLKLSPAISLIQIIRRWSSLSTKNVCNQNNHPVDVPRGHFAVYVGENRTRYIIPIIWLEDPTFQCLLRRGKEEYGYKQDMGLTIPCEEYDFQVLTSMLSSAGTDSQPRGQLNLRTVLSS